MSDVEAEERERRRLAVTLHDGAGQALALAEMKLARVLPSLEGAVRAEVASALDLVREASAHQRALSCELSPPLLHEAGLASALQWLAEDLETRHGFRTEVVAHGERLPLGEGARGVVFRAVRELVLNVLKHAKVMSARVTIAREGDVCAIEVEDAGAGFDPAPGELPRGFGLATVHEQLARLGATLTVASTPAGGTRARLRVPMEKDR